MISPPRPAPRPRRLAARPPDGPDPETPAVPDRPLAVAIHGATGRMGTRLIQLVAADPELTLAGALDRPGHPRIGQDVGPSVGLGELGVPIRAAEAGWSGADVVVDFSTPAAALALAARCAADRVPLVVGTTGFEPEQRRDVEAVAATIPLLIASNFSRAVNLLMHLSAVAAKALGDAADVEVVERHHRFKKDAPSGTALRLAEVVARELGLGPESYAHGRAGLVGERPRAEIGLHALRTGDNPGEHTVVFGLLGECLELTHRALNRDGFARGALDAAKFLAGKPPGLYTMADLLGF
jgi:4-hydroxy-tetrahydrodipicolinate reductase